MTSAPLLSVQNQLQHILIPQWKAAGRKFTAQDGALGREGNEGHSTGMHLHMQVNIGSVGGAPVDLFRWLDEHMPDLQTTVQIDNKNNMKVSWNDSANALVNTTESIAVQQANRINDAGVQEGYTLTYAWEEGKSMDEMKRVVWYTNEDAGFAGWLQIDAAGKFIKDQNNRPLQWIPSSSEKWLPVIINL